MIGSIVIFLNEVIKESPGLIFILDITDSVDAYLEDIICIFKLNTFKETDWNLILSEIVCYENEIWHLVGGTYEILRDNLR